MEPELGPNWLQIHFDFKILLRTYNSENQDSVDEQVSKAAADDEGQRDAPKGLQEIKVRLKNEFCDASDEGLRIWSSDLRTHGTLDYRYSRIRRS